MTSLVDFQKSIFDQIESFKSRGEERLVIRFLSGGLHWAIDSETIANVSLLPNTMPVIPAAPSYIRGLVQQDGNVLTVFDLGQLITGKPTPKTRTNRVLMLHSNLALATALLVEKTFGLVSLDSLSASSEKTIVPSAVERWVDSRWIHDDSSDVIWHWIQPDTLLTDAAFVSRRTQ